ncbi:MAG TPA: hypothetical protein VF614_18335 [Chthoniobacteraceae bacterium]|jgi:hypothetical protein
MPGDYVPVPIEAAKRIAADFDKQQVAIWTYDAAHRTQHVTTFGGPSLSDSFRAAEAGNAIKRLAKWAESECQALPQSLAQIYGELDVEAANAVENEGADKATVLSMFYLIREVIRRRDPQLAEHLTAERTERAEPRVALSQLEQGEEQHG